MALGACVVARVSSHSAAAGRDREGDGILDRFCVEEGLERCWREDAMRDGVADDMRKALAEPIPLEKRKAALSTANGEISAIFEHEPKVACRLRAEVAGLDDQARGEGAGDEGLTEVREIIRKVRAALGRDREAPDELVLEEYLDERVRGSDGDLPPDQGGGKPVVPFPYLDELIGMDRGDSPGRRNEKLRGKAMETGPLRPVKGDPRRYARGAMNVPTVFLAGPDSRECVQFVER